MINFYFDDENIIEYASVSDSVVSTSAASETSSGETESVIVTSFDIPDVVTREDYYSVSAVLILSVAFACGIIAALGFWQRWQPVNARGINDDK